MIRRSYGVVAANKIVDKLIEAIDPDEFTREIASAWAEDHLVRSLTNAADLTIDFAFTISTGDTDAMCDNLREDGIDPDSLDWDKLQSSFQTLETNILEMVAEHGINLRPEGHNGEGDLVGSASLHTKFGPYTEAINTKGIAFVRLMIEDNNEPLRSSSGTLHHLGDVKRIYKNVDPLIERAADVSFEFWNTGKLVAFFEGLANYTPMEELIAQLLLDEGKKKLAALPDHPFLAPPEPSGIFRKDTDGVIIFSARCPGCKRIHGNFRTYEEATGNRQCKYCTREYVEKMTKVATTGNFKHLLKKDHQKKAERSGVVKA